jgi:hypothetical protein
VKTVIPILAWGFIGWASVFVRPPEPPCPKPPLWKYTVAFVCGIIGGGAYFFLAGFKDVFSSIDFIAASICAAALGRFAYSLICPLPPTRS